MGKFCVYRTTHPTGFYYVGKGITERVEAGKYKGSGVKLKAAFQAGYPFEEWTSVVLHTFDDEDAAFVKERELVNWDLLMDPYCLNTHLGGKGWKYGRLTDAQLRKRSAKISAALKGRKLSEEHKRKVSEAVKKQDLTVQLAALRKSNIGRKKSAAEIERTASKNRGQKRSPTTRERQREKQLSHPRILCLTCNESFRPACYARYHGEKCKGPKPVKTPAPTSRTCENCFGIFTPANYGRWHGPRCKTHTLHPNKD